MPFRSPLSISRSWYEKSKLAEDEFDKFVFLWFSFNALYNEFLESKMPETNAIIKFIKNKFRNFNKSEINKIFNSDYVKFFIKRVIRDCRGKSKDTSESIRSFENKENTLCYRLNSLFLILYQVRCNLFHGNKEFLNDSDSEVMKNAAGLLQMIMKLILSL